MARLGDICTVVSGTTPKTNNPDFWDGDIIWITPAELSEDTVMVYESKRKITLKGVQSCGLSPIPAGTVILSSRAPIGKTAIAGTEMYCNQGFKNLICSERIFNKYLFWFLRCNTEYLNSLGRGATFKEISKAIVEDIDIPLPDLPTQRRIAATLDKVSEGIALCKQMLVGLDELVKSQFVEMFGRPEDWSDELKYLGDHIDLINGFAFLSENFSEDGIPVIKIRNVNTADFSRGNMQYHPYDPSLKKYIVEPGDLLISLTGTVGKEDFANVCLADNTYDTYYLNQRNAKLVPHEELTKEFLLHFLKYDYIKRKLIKQGTGVRQCHLHNKDINEIQLIIPSKDKQSEFAKVTHQSYKSKFAVQQQLAELETLKKSLMQKYFG